MARWNLPVVRFVLMLLLLAWQGARADTPIRMFQSHVGNVNFVGTQKTIRDRSNNSPCRVFAPSVDRYAALTGIPASATILSAQLYWAGSGYNPDFTVTMDGAAISAPSDRRYYSTTIGNNYNYFSGAADVTAQVKIKRNATYAFRGLTVDYDSPYCAVEGVLGGFSLVVIYSDASQPFRMLNLYEGFQYMRYSGFTLNLSGFRIPDPIGTATGRVGHVTWEGDSTLDGSGEDLLFNNYELTDSRNPSGNQFNSKSSINGDDASYGIDFDAYTVGNPVIKSGQTTASTRYQSGQDLVLLSAEVVALPNIPLADLSISMQLNGQLTQGQNASYTIGVTNLGPSIANSPTVVTSTLPAGLTYVSGTGDGWSCEGIGQKVTCTSTTALSAGKSVPALTLTVKVTGTGDITASALVTGKTFDPQTGNNAASVKSTVVSGTADYVFTSGACVDGLAFGAPTQDCSEILPEVKAGEDARIYMTALSKDRVPTGPTKDMTVDMKIRMVCHDPNRNAGVSATYNGAQMPLCASVDDSGAAIWSNNASLLFKSKIPSVALNIVYNDVGLIQLAAQMGVDKASIVSPTFVSVPHEIRFTTGAPGLLDAPIDQFSTVFGKAGTTFGLEVGAYTGGAMPQLAPNFGRESTPVTFLAPGVANGGVAGSTAFAAMSALPEIIEKMAFSGAANKASGTFAFPEVGVVKLTPVLSTTTYLQKPVTLKSAYARFIPHHFTTSAVVMKCVTNMKCDDDADVKTAAYSLQPIEVIVAALAEGGTPTINYHSVLARKVGLTAWSGAAKDQPRVAGFTTLKAIDGTSFNKTALKDNDGKAVGEVSYDLTRPFVHTAPQATWSAPADIYLRAAEIAGDGVTSDKAGESFEVGIRIVSGRLLVPNVHGSERLALPLKVNGQYWTGTNWELSRNDTGRNEVDPKKALFSNAGGLVPSFTPDTLLLLDNGVAGFFIKVNPVKTGTVDLIMNHHPWLPSTKGRLKFGTYKSPLIYLRELH